MSRYLLPCESMKSLYNMTNRTLISRYLYFDAYQFYGQNLPDTYLPTNIFQCSSIGRLVQVPKKKPKRVLVKCTCIDFFYFIFKAIQASQTVFWTNLLERSLIIFLFFCEKKQPPNFLSSYFIRTNYLSAPLAWSHWYLFKFYVIKIMMKLQITIKMRHYYLKQ